MPMDEIVLIAIVVAVFVSLYIASWLLKVAMRGAWNIFCYITSYHCVRYPNKH
jgi:hypothetical protein